MVTVVAVNVGQVRATAYGPLGRTAIDKRPVAGRVPIGRLGVAGDEHADTRHHGGPDRAVYAFAREDYAHWEAQLGRALPSGSFGENLTTIGLDVQNSRIGDRWRVGSSVLEITSVRIPCSVFAGFVDEPHWVRRFTEHGVPGAYLRVVQPGAAGGGDPIEVLERRPHELTVGYAFRAATTEPALLAGLAREPRVGGSLRDKVERYLESHGC